MDIPLADHLSSEASPLAFAMGEQSAQSLAMVREALRSRRLALAWQPIVWGAEPRKIAMYEGLIRVLDPTGRSIPAREFMPFVETIELGREIDCAALALGLEALRSYPALRVAVNMSARSIGFPRWMRVLQHGLAADPTAGERLVLEITETSAMQVPEIVVAFMDEVRGLGVCFALDDFGAGFSSFRYLRDFCFDIIKIDGQFIRGIDRNPDNQALTRALIAVGRHFDMMTVAESVETEAEARWLQAEGVDRMQGHLFGSPTVRPVWAEAAQRRRA